VFQDAMQYIVRELRHYKHDLIVEQLMSVDLYMDKPNYDQENQ
jgi:hypothetical protein